MENQDKYYDNVVLKVVSGIDYGFWAKLIEAIMTADDKNYKKLSTQYKGLMSAIDRYNQAHRGLVETKLQRRK